MEEVRAAEAEADMEELQALAWQAELEQSEVAVPPPPVAPARNVPRDIKKRLSWAAEVDCVNARFGPGVKCDDGCCDTSVSRGRGRGRGGWRRSGQLPLIGELAAEAEAARENSSFPRQL